MIQWGSSAHDWLCDCWPALDTIIPLVGFHFSAAKPSGWVLVTQRQLPFPAIPASVFFVACAIYRKRTFLHVIAIDMAAGVAKRYVGRIDRGHDTRDQQLAGPDRSHRKDHFSSLGARID